VTIAVDTNPLICAHRSYAEGGVTIASMGPRHHHDTGACTRAVSCNTNEYVRSKVITLRIEPDLLDRLREVAKAQRRSVPAQVLFVVRRELETKATRTPRALPTLGWLRHLEPPDRLDEFRRVRRSISRQFAARVRRRVGAN
jgi:hypothetical protein